jgi:hypothetical protein
MQILGFAPWQEVGSGSFVLIPLEIAHDSEMKSPAIPI